MARSKKTPDEQWQSKPGQHGTLYRYAIEYTDDHEGSASGVMVTHSWAYNEEHAVMKFEEGIDADGWKVLSVRRLKVQDTTKDRGKKLVLGRLV